MTSGDKAFTAATTENIMWVMEDPVDILPYKTCYLCAHEKKKICIKQHVYYMLVNKK